MAKKAILETGKERNRRQPGTSLQHHSVSFPFSRQPTCLYSQPRMCTGRLGSLLSALPLFPKVCTLLTARVGF